MRCSFRISQEAIPSRISAQKVTGIRGSGTYAELAGAADRGVLLAIPFFQSMVHPWEDGHWYLAEDYAFCERARQCGIKIIADTTVRLWHIGTYPYGWEESSSERPRSPSFTLHVRGKAPNQDS
jgi:hypothetical protein